MVDRQSRLCHIMLEGGKVPGSRKWEGGTAPEMRLRFCLH